MKNIIKFNTSINDLNKTTKSLKFDISNLEIEAKK